MSPSRDEAVAAIRARAVRREAIATAVLAGLCADPRVKGVREPSVVGEVCDLADALIAELDRRRQAEEAQA